MQIPLELPQRQSEIEGIDGYIIVLTKEGVMKFFKINPLDYIRGLIKFPIGFYKYDKCDCSTCKGVNGG